MLCSLKKGIGDRARGKVRLCVCTPAPLSSFPRGGQGSFSWEWGNTKFLGTNLNEGLVCWGNLGCGDVSPGFRIASRAHSGPSLVQERKNVADCQAHTLHM